MTDELKKRITELARLAPALNSATDQASNLVGLVEKFLVEELHIGISAEVYYEELPAGTDDEGHALRIRHSLAFGRSGGSFRIHVVRETVAVDDLASARAALEQSESSGLAPERQSSRRSRSFRSCWTRSSRKPSGWLRRPKRPASRSRR